MLCTEGLQLFRKFEHSVEERNRAREQALPDEEQSAEPAERSYHVSREKGAYKMEYLAWVSHRTFCVQCRSVAASRDMVALLSH